MDFLYFSRVRMCSYDVSGEFSDTGNLEGGIGKLEFKLETGKGDWKGEQENWKTETETRT